MQRWVKLRRLESAVVALVVPSGRRCGKNSPEPRWLKAVPTTPNRDPLGGRG